MDAKDLIDQLEHRLRHSQCEDELTLREIVKEIRTCPYAGHIGSKCKKVYKEVSDE